MRQRIRSHLTYANVISTLCLFLLLGGGSAVALTGSNTVFTDDIVNGEVKVADIGQGAVATDEIANGQVKAADIGGGEVRSPNVLNDNLAGADVADNSLKGADIDESTLSNIGGGGPAGGDLTGTYPNPEIANQTVGIFELARIAVASDSTQVPPGGGVGSVTAVCPEGTLLISGGAYFPFSSGDLSASFASPVAGQWVARGQNNGTVEQSLTARAFCLEAGL